MDKTASESTKETALRKAIKHHVWLMNECKNGRGVDRPLYGYLWLARQKVQRIPNYKLPPLYLDKAYPLMKTDMMSTSNCGNKVLSLFGFGPTASTGLGLGYIIKENDIHVNITSFIGEAKKYKQALEQTFVELQHLVEKSKPRSKM